MGGKFWCIRDVCGLFCVFFTWLLILYAEYVSKPIHSKTVNYRCLLIISQQVRCPPRDLVLPPQQSVQRNQRADIPGGWNSIDKRLGGGVDLHVTLIYADFVLNVLFWRALLSLLSALTCVQCSQILVWVNCFLQKISCMHVTLSQELYRKEMPPKRTSKEWGLRKGRLVLYKKWIGFQGFSILRWSSNAPSAVASSQKGRITALFARGDHNTYFNGNFQKFLNMVICLDVSKRWTTIVPGWTIVLESR